MGLCISKSTSRSEGVEPSDRARSRQPTAAGGSPASSWGSESLADSPPISPRAERLPVPCDIPARPRAKIAALADATQRAHEIGVDPALIAYASQALDKIDWQPPDIELSQLDRLHLPALAAECNRRHPGLNAATFNTPSAFLEQLGRADNPKAWRGLVQVGPPSLHRIAVDVRHHADGSISALLLDAARAYDRKAYPNIYLRGYVPFMKALRDDFGGRCRFAVIESDAQKSRAGCSIYSLSYALELHRHSAVVGAFHERLHTEGRCLPEGHAASALTRDFELVDGRAILPPSFYKHAQSKKTADHVVATQGSEAARQRVSTGSGPAQTLGERMQDFRVHREDAHDEGGPLDYSMSIETARLTKLRHVLESAVQEREGQAGASTPPGHVSSPT
jgi:YopJ protease family